jgi:sec-independent protein translocase protein TatA
MSPSLIPLGFIEGIGGPEMLMILVIILLLFGGQKLPEFARGLGKSIREFRKAAAGVEEEFKRALEEDERKKNPPPPPPTYPSYPPNPDVQDSSCSDPDAYRSATDPYQDSYTPPEVANPALPAENPTKTPAATSEASAAASPAAETAAGSPAPAPSPAEPTTPPSSPPAAPPTPDHPGPRA